MKLNYLLFSLLFTLIVNLGYAQKNKQYMFGGNVLVENKSANDVLLKLYEGNDCIATYTTESKGRFLFSCGVEKYYTLEFKKEGYVTKRVVINTRDTKYIRKKIKVFEFDVVLIKESSEVDYEEYDFPVTIIEISKNRDEFVQNSKYTRKRRIANNMNLDKQETAAK